MFVIGHDSLRLCLRCGVRTPHNIMEGKDGRHGGYECEKCGEKSSFHPHHMVVHSGPANSVQNPKLP